MAVIEQPVEPVLVLTDAPDPGDTAVIANGLGAYNESKAGYRDYRPLAIFASDPDTGEIIGGLFGRSSLGQLFIDRFFLPETLRGGGLGSRILAMAEEEGRRRGCSRVSLFTLSFQAPGFYLKQGYEAAARLDCDPPGATRFLMTKRLAPAIL
jgi:GNAT superfamily N-acetyltransferase